MLELSKITYLNVMNVHCCTYPTFTGTSVIVSLPKMSITLTATV